MLCIISVMQIDEMKLKKLFISFCLCIQDRNNDCISHGMGCFVVMCRKTYNPAIRGISLLPLPSSQSSHDEVPCHFSSLSSHLPMHPLVFPHCQNSDRRVRLCARGVLSSAVRKPTALCANHNQTAPRSFHLVQQSGTRHSIIERKTTWSEKIWASAVRHRNHTTIHCWNKLQYTTKTNKRNSQSQRSSQLINH